MKVALFYVESQKENWAVEAQNVYSEKIARFCDFELIRIKSPPLARGQKEQKIQEEAKSILSKLKDQDHLILFDERGKTSDSLDFSKQFQTAMDSNPKRIVFLIGGAFGVSDKVQDRANKKIALSKMVMNHHVALVAALEQIYRAFTIQNGIPYHNE